ncbi:MULTISPECIES: DEAD/DEAH box helicase [unclassified Lentimicrobium]|uniref:DEAD/DEAH box helicase n=1 Tax=unclassified Lentimicrobium TaxID=2677434 RepID=UPI00155337A8|nr:MULTISPECIES: DEAD/DEAH box helicase [unclassified Lentimicrobium]NPD47504.1 DEAD/DEAH box helicase [Lentimicrobium sp. S6]NPD87006.1 DEAD/DEAH box helicase [Lentimicrobium sp. L6]
MSFNSLGLSWSLLDALEKNNFTESYPIQEQAIPAILKGNDILGIAKTGSGKTMAYVLPLLMNVDATKSKNRHIETLVLVPTRELAVQVREVFEQFKITLKERIKTLAVFGGVAINPQMKAMQNVDILIATPGRLLELVDNNALCLADVDTLVLDEADKMLNLGFQEEMKKILRMLPLDRQNLLFSATLSDDVSSFQKGLLKQPLVIKLVEDIHDVGLIDQTAYIVPTEKKGPLLRQLIKSKDMHQVLIFASSAYQAEHIADKLRRNAIHATAMHGKKSQNARTENLRKFKTGKLRVLVSTDLLARGIDIEFLPYVINYDLPRSPKDYIHRIGRTGRAESSGEAISFVTPEDEAHFKVIQKRMGKWVDLIDYKSIDLKGF